MFLFSRCTCEFTVVKSRFSVVSVLKLSLNPGTSLRMSGSTQEKNHISVKSAGNVSPSPRRTRITCTYTSNYVWTRSMRKPRPIIPINLLNFTQEKLWKACKQFVLIWLRINISGILRFWSWELWEMKYDQILSFFVVFTVSLKLWSLVSQQR